MSIIIIPLTIPIKVITTITIPYEDLGDATWSVDNLTGKVNGFRSLKCAWANRDELVRQLLGYMEVVGSNLYVHMPQLFPTSKLGSPRCYAQSIGGKGGPGNKIFEDTVTQHTAIYEFATIGVNYSTHTGEIWRRETMRNMAEMVIMPGENRLHWTGGEECKESPLPGYIIHGSEWTYSIYQSGDPHHGYEDLVGCCNSSSVRSPTFHRTFTRGTLKFIGATFNVQQDFNGNVMTEYILTFHARKDDWNKFPHEVGGEIIFDYVYNADDDKYISAPYENLHHLII